MNYFSENSTIEEVLTKYPETLDIFINAGFDKLKDPQIRAKISSSLTLKTALQLKNINYATFSKTLIEIIEIKNTNFDISKQKNIKADYNIIGSLPCPVRIPLLEEINNFLDTFKIKYKKIISLELKAASMGVDWLEEKIRNAKSEKDLPDIFLSAGFDLFFDENLLGKYKKENVFKDKTNITETNIDFKDINILDPNKHYGIIGVVPAVFLINKEEFKNSDYPKSWKDILSPKYNKKISLPVGDFDLFNGILLNIYKEFGDDGLEKLGKNLLKGMHPAQMVKSDHQKIDKPAITIMPYFFTKTITHNSSMKAIWPQDGAIICPIFMLTKNIQNQDFQKIIEVFSSQKVGEILSHKGLFPSIRKDVNNNLPLNSKFKWLGWDFIEKNDMNKKIKHCDKIFTEATRR